MLRRFKSLHSLRFLFSAVIVVLCIDLRSLYAKATGTTQKTETSQNSISSVAKPEVDIKKDFDKVQVVEAKKNSIVVAQPPVSVKFKLSLEEIYASSLQEKSGISGTSIRSKSFIPAELTTDLYTQSQAHMSVPEIKQLIEKTYNIKPYQKLINSILDREKEYAEDYVFYHGIDNVWRVPQDLYTRLYAHFKKVPADRMEDFIFLRFNGLDDFKMNDFLINKTKESGLINDHELGNDLIAANLALFGNVGTQPECTWQYFIKSRGHANPARAIYEKIMDKFNLTHKYIAELMSLVDMYQTKEETILQIFVPKDKINEIGYLAWIRGIPAYQGLMHTVLRSVKEKKFPKTAPALDYYSALLKQEQEKNPLFKNLIDRLKAGEFSLNYFLTFYRNRPTEIEDINNFQARLFLTHDVLLNPLSGVKIFRYSTATPEQLNAYHQKLDTIIKKIIAEKQ